MALKKKP